MVTSLSKIFRIKRRVSWRSDGKEGVKRGEERERRSEEVCDGGEGGREREGRERSTQLHGIFALHQRAGRLHNGIERNSPGFLFTELIS